MPDAMPIAASSSPSSVRASSWRRAAAIGIDLLLVNLIVAAAGLAAALATDGRVRVFGTVVNVVKCTRSEAVPAQLELPAGFETSSARRCTRSIFGIAHDWQLVVIDKAADASASSAVQINIATDPTGRFAEVFYLDDLNLLLLIPYLFWWEWRRGATAGKFLVGIQVRALGGAPLDKVAAAKRNLFKLVVLLGMLSASGFVGPSSTETKWYNLKLITSYGANGFGAWSDALSLLALVYVAGCLVATARGWLTVHDLWAGTEVVRAGASTPAA